MAEATSVLDASALIALLIGEPGADRVDALKAHAVISTVNWAEVLELTQALGLPTDARRAQVERFGIRIVAFSPRHAEAAAALRPATRKAGLSLGDRACLALALDLGAVAVTADRVWEKLDVGVEVELIR